MRLKALVMAGAIVVATSSVALAQTDCTKILPPSPWGPNDQTGATNRVTPAVTKAAAAEIQEGKVVPLSYPLADGVPLFGTRFTKTILTATSLARAPDGNWIALRAEVPNVPARGLPQNADLIANLPAKPAAR